MDGRTWWLWAVCVGAVGCGGSGGSAGTDAGGSGGGAGGSPAEGGTGGGGSGGGAGEASLVFPEGALVDAELRLTEDDWARLTAEASTESEYPADLTWNGLTARQASLKIVGAKDALAVSGAAIPNDRFSFKLDFNDTLADQTLDGEKKLNLHNGREDPTHLREILALSLLRRLGVETPRAVLVHLKVNGASLGIYTAVEEVDKGFLEDHFADPDGSLYELEAPAGTLLPPEEAPTEDSGLEIRRGEAIGDYLALVELLADPAAEPERLVAVDDALRYLAAEAVAVDLGGYLGRDAEMLLYRASGRFLPLAFRAREPFGMATCGCTVDGLLALPVDEASCDPLAERPLAARLLASADHRARYHELVAEAADALEALAPQATALAALVRPVLAADPGPFFTLEAFERNLTDDVPRPAEADGTASDKADYIGLARFFTARAASVRAQLAGAAPVDAGGRGACPKAAAENE